MDNDGKFLNFLWKLCFYLFRVVNFNGKELCFYGRYVKFFDKKKIC